MIADASHRAEAKSQKAKPPDASQVLCAALLTAAVVALAAVPPSFFERLLSVCLYRHVFGFCPFCGSLRALVRLFHGDVAGAVRFNRNVIVTAPTLVFVLLDSLRRAMPVLRRARPLAPARVVGPGRRGAGPAVQGRQSISEPG